MIRHIIFDMGNVLIRYAPEQFIHHFTSDPEEQDILLDEIFRSTKWLDYDRGTLTKDKLIETVCQQIPVSMHSLAKEVLDVWYEGMTPIAEMESVVKHLSEKGYTLYLLSNTSQDFYQFKEDIPCLRHFDGLFISSDWKCLKPEPIIYQHFFNYFNLDPENCFFVDDLAENIQQAKHFGMKGHIFDGDVEALLKAFRKENISL